MKQSIDIKQRGRRLRCAFKFPFTLKQNTDDLVLQQGLDDPSVIREADALYLISLLNIA